MNRYQRRRSGSSEFHITLAQTSTEQQFASYQLALDHIENCSRHNNVMIRDFLESVPSQDLKDKVTAFIIALLGNWLLLI